MTRGVGGKPMGSHRGYTDTTDKTQATRRSFSVEIHRTSIDTCCIFHLRSQNKSLKKTSELTKNT